MSATTGPAATGGLLNGLRVIELATDHAAFAGKMLGDLGAGAFALAVAYLTGVAAVRLEKEAAIDAQDF